MSRIGKQPVPIPDKVKVTINGGHVLVEGPKGKVEKRIRNSWDAGDGRLATRCRYWQIAGGFDSGSSEASGAGAGMGRSSASKPINNQNETTCPLGTARHKELDLPNARTPILLAHGRQDPMVVLSRATASRDMLAGLGYRVQWHDYTMGHSVCPEELIDIGAWLRQVLVEFAEQREAGA